MNVTIYFDGGASPNPGKAYGSYSVESQEPALNHRSIRQQFGDTLTNNQAEYLSLIAALKWLRHHTDPATTSLQIFTDSTLVQGQLGKRWKCKLLHLRELLDEAKLLLAPYSGWRIHWNGRQVNVRKFGH